MTLLASACLQLVLQATAVQESATALAPAMQRYQISIAESEVGFDGSSTLHDFTGRSRAVHGELRTALDAVATTSGGSFWFEARTLDTGNSSRDSEMRETLEVDTFPRISFTIDGIRGALGAARSRVQANGRFTIHGIERTRSFPIEVERLAAGRLRVRGELRFDITEHRIEPPRVLFVSMDEEVRVFFDLLLVPLAAETVAAEARAIAQASVPSGLWLTDDGGLLLEVGSTWVLARGTTARRVDVASARFALAATPPSPAAAATVAARDGVLSIACDGRTWVELEGLSGDAPLPRALAAAGSLPAGVRAELERLTGVPARARLVLLEPGFDADERPVWSERVLELAFGPPRPGRTPSWVWQPETWVSSR
jgi:polyisoprenoid-binding protein YceI